MQFTCDICGGVFTSDVSDETAADECLAIFGVPHQPDDAVVCDDCYQLSRTYWMCDGNCTTIAIGPHRHYGRNIILPLPGQDSVEVGVEGSQGSA